MGVQRWRRLLGADNPEAWLRTVAINLARSRWRRAQRWVGLAPRLVEEPRDGDTEGHCLASASRNLPAGQREVIALHHLADLTVEQAATRSAYRPGQSRHDSLGVGPPSPRCSSRRDPKSEFTPLREAIDTLASRTPSPDFGELKRRATRRGRRCAAMVGPPPLR
jgi:hypothetical protein